MDKIKKKSNLLNQILSFSGFNHTQLWSPVLWVVQLYPQMACGLAECVLLNSQIPFLALLRQSSPFRIGTGNVNGLEQVRKTSLKNGLIKIARFKTCTPYKGQQMQENERRRNQLTNGRRKKQQKTRQTTKQTEEDVSQGEN